MPRASEQELNAGLSRMLGDWGRRSLDEYAQKHNAANRQKLAKEGKALSDGSYPIEDAKDLKDAATLASSGHGDVSAAKALVRKRAKELGVSVETLPGFGKEKADADAAQDRAVLAAINRAIELQTGDNDSPADAKVMAALREAKSAQEADMREGG